MAAPSNTTITTTVIEIHQVAPPSDAAIDQELILPLLHFDILFLQLQSKFTLFYEFPNCSKSHFLEKIVPRLKNSLSLSLKHFLPLAGHIVLPPTTTSATPFARYVAGDSVSLTIAESSADFQYLTGNHSRDANEFENFVPQFPPHTLSPDSSTLLPVTAIQITLFPTKGISIGFTFQHAICDGAATMSFFLAWASTNKSNGKKQIKFFPSYDRTTIVKAPYELDLQSNYWNQLKNLITKNSIRKPSPTSQATFVLTEPNIQNLMNFARRRMKVPDDLPYLTPFTVVCSYLWVCLVKSAAAVDEVADEEPEHFYCAIDCKPLMAPPIVPNYFGNCLALVKAKASHGKLIKGKEGLLAAVEMIGKSIEKTREMRIRYQNKVDAVSNPLAEVLNLEGERVMNIVGSPRFDVYGGVDFGFGRMKKFEPVSNGKHGRTFLCKSRDGINGGIEISIGMSKMQMDAFSAIFHELIQAYQLPAIRSAL